MTPYLAHTNVYDEDANIIKQVAQKFDKILPGVRLPTGKDQIVNPYPKIEAFRTARYRYSTFVMVRNRYNDSICYVPLGWEEHPEWTITKALTFTW